MPTPGNRSVNLSSLFRRRQHYSKTRPLEKRLVPVFAGNRVTKMTRYAIRFMPSIAVFAFCRQIALGDQLRPAVITALFALSLPTQGLWQLGKRSVTLLSPAILDWFYEVRGKLQELGQVLVPVEDKPNYQALADILKCAFKQLGKTFLDDLQLTPDHAYKRRHIQPSFFSPQQGDTGVNNGNDQRATSYSV